ncbi:MAG: fructose-6-phosphate aldolase [Dehalococcoidia bacterium]|nr:fructose-6-phosphate aldolase [Dehalococcoidia bacterium]
MHLFLDTANIDEIRRGASMGVISGVTTNPSLVAKEGRSDLKSALLEIASVVNGPISIEVIAQDLEGMIGEAREIATWHPNVVVKIPVTAMGLEAISILSREGIKINMTLTFSVNQALLGALAGATYISPFVGRLDDEGHDGMAMVAEVAQIFKHYGLGTKVLAASIRHPLHVIAAAKAGADIATIPYKVLTQMVHHPLTDVGIVRFNEDWQRLVRSR